MDFRLNHFFSTVWLFTVLFKLSRTQVVNVAVNQTATQQNTLNYGPSGGDAFDWTADKAVDNCLLRDDPDIQQCCSATDADRTINYWDLTLARRYEIEEIKIYARTGQLADNQLQDFQLFLSEEVGGSEELVTSTPAEVDDIYTFSFTPPRNVSVITIRRPTTNLIVLCELQAFAVCDAGFYGPNCTLECGGCLDNAACNRTTGVCPGDCEPGYYNDTCTPCGHCLDGQACNYTNGFCSNGCAAGYRGDLCVDVCENRTYGVNCNQTCGNCVDTCHTVNGTCPASGCQAGWQGVMCDQECDNNMYGMNCSMSCGNCLDGEQCHHINGSCLNGCDPGWQAGMCVDACTNNTYGSNCNSTCGNCINGTQCNHVNGICESGCEPGYSGDKCITECTGNTYGENCSETCGNCLGGEQCNIINGTCETGCAAGWLGQMCMTACTSPSFGQNCSETCYCESNATCDHVTGKCPGSCQPGYFQESCSMTCQNKTYGPGCDSDCGSCANETACNIDDGVCQEGCSPGWLLSNCSQACDPGNFGTNCTEQCGNCLGNEDCNFETGSCPRGCAAGWTGEFCTDECENGTFGTNCSTRCYCADKVPCNKTTGLCPAGCELGYMGDFCEFDTNRAKEKPAYQSTTLFSNGFNWTASLAVDGYNDQEDPETSRTCSSTTVESAPWWYLDMEELAVVDSILVYGQLVDPSLLSGFRLYLSNNTNFTDDSPVFTQSGDYGNGIFNVTVNGTLTKYIYITQPVPSATGGMSICELRVFGECQDGKFGPECQDVCHCENGVPCNKTTGECPGGACQPGWEPTTCSQSCQNNKYGPQCSKSCGHCTNNEACDTVNGTCYSGCAPGWRTDFCNEECESGTYGQGCNGTCGQCKSGSCDHEDGGCDNGCAAGYKGTSCHEECEAGKHGENCASDCGKCKTDGVCDKSDGACPDGCQDGYQEPLCVAAIKQEDEDSGGNNVGAIIGGIFGGIGFIVLVFIIYKVVQRNRKKKAGADYFTSYTKDHGASSTNTNTEDNSYAFVNKSFNTKF